MSYIRASMSYEGNVLDGAARFSISKGGRSCELLEVKEDPSHNYCTHVGSLPL